VFYSTAHISFAKYIRTDTVVQSFIGEDLGYSTSGIGRSP
jgi:hypothetical protein